MKEKLIEFKTAKLAKEKGFDEPCFNSFSRSGKSREMLSDSGEFALSRPEYFNSRTRFPCDFVSGYNFARPTQSSLQTWLRNKHGLFAYIDWATNEAVCLDYKNTDGKELIREDTYYFVPDHEDGEVLEKLLFETLKFIK